MYDTVCEDLNPSQKQRDSKVAPYSNVFVFNNYQLACEKLP